MKILLINNKYSGGGAENYVKNLKDLLEDEHDVRLLTLDGSQESEYSVNEKKNILSRFRNRYYKNSRITEEIKNKIQDFDPDLIHLNSISIAPLSVLEAIEDKKVVKTVHDFGYMHPEDRLAYEMSTPEKKIRMQLEKIKNSVLSKLRKDKIDEFIAPSSALTQELEKAGYSPVNHIPNFVEEREPSYSGEYFLFVGRLIDGKAPDTLLKAYTSSMPDLQIAGSGQMKQELEQKVKSEDMENVKIHGYVADEKLEELYKNSKAVIIPSRWRENNPLVALEAKSYGTALIVSDQGGLPELVKEGETGFIFESENVEGLKKALSKEADWEKLGENSRQDYEQNYRPEVHIEKLLDVYNSIEEK